jgi:hypothetical protein
MELVDKINETYGIRVYANEFLMNPSIGKMAVLLENELSGTLEIPEDINKNTKQKKSTIQFSNDSKTTVKKYRSIREK